MYGENFDRLAMYTENSLPSQYTSPMFHAELATPTRKLVGSVVMPTVRAEMLMVGIVGLKWC
jgi:hypothetical protein